MINNLGYNYKENNEKDYTSIKDKWYLNLQMIITYRIPEYSNIRGYKMRVIAVISFIIIYLEMVFKIVVLKSVGILDIGFTLLFSIPNIMILNLLCSVFKKKVSKIILIISTVILTIYFMIQAIFYDLFNVPFSFMTIGLAGNALDFISIIKDAILQNWFSLLLLIIPMILLICLHKKIRFNKFNGKNIGIWILTIIVYIIFIIGIVLVDSKGVYSSYNLLFNINAQEKNIEKFGLIDSTGIDIIRSIFGFEEKAVIDNNEEKNEKEENKIEEPEVVEPTYNELDLGLEELIAQTDDEGLKNVYEYINSKEPTNKNKYTGYFKGKNLIFILAEGFNSIAVDKNLTPTLYKLVNSGFVFNNFYTPVFLSTTGGEFQATTGLIPTQNILNLWKKNKPQISYALGNSFRKLGYVANAYHDWTYTYYSRQDTMETLGFDSYMGIGNGLEKLMDGKWIPRDVDMINVTTDLYSSEDKFVTYYVTVSGHAPYNFGTANSTATRYKEDVQNLSYSTPVKAYLATQMELDRALELLINKLEQKGILDDTVIALVGDHYPYTLTIDQVNEVSNYERDEVVEVNKSNFILWNSKMKETINVNKVGSQIDVLPTLLNLFGIEYDSRLIMGQDILSENPGLAIFSNRSWVTDLGTYFSSERNFVPKQDAEIPENYVSDMNRKVANMFTMSQSFLKYNIYEKLLK